MFAACQTLKPTSTVSQSVTCRFYSPYESNLVIGGANQLSVYRILNNKKLELRQSFELYGTVASIQRVTLGKKQNFKRDSLVLSFHDAKLSIVEYNPETHDLKTISMHYFEDDDLRSGYVTNHVHPPIVRVDPENRCVALLIYGCHILVIPLDKDEEEDDLENELHDDMSNFSDDFEMTHDDSDRIRSTVAAGQVASLNLTVTPSFKSPVLPSYQLDLSQENCGEKIDNIVDIQFLHNYNDPTLAVLYEPSPTWSGRVAVRQDTFSMVTLSLNVHTHLQPIIWNVNNLPFDSFKIVPVPRPIGGLLIVACNELIYLNQSVPAYGMSFNPFTKDSSTFPFNNLENDQEDHKVDYLNISLDLSHTVFLTHNKILFILKDGDVYLVTLFNDDMRSIKNFYFERIASTVQPNCLTLCENNLLFIGSHVGDSVLAEIIGDLKSTHVEAYDADDVDSLISTNEKEQLSFQEHDRLPSTSSSGYICYGEAVDISESLYHDPRDPHVELVTSAGHHKNGSICVSQRTIKPLIDDTYELKDCGDLWTVKPSKQSDPSNSRLLLNRLRETMIFSTKGELLELGREECAFDTSEQTIFATNLGKDNLTLQVNSSRALLISDDKLISKIEFEVKIRDVCSSDNHIVMLGEDNSIHYLELDYTESNQDDHDFDDMTGRENGQYSLSQTSVHQLSSSRIISLTLYKDESGLFRCETDKSDSDEPTYWLLTTDDRGVLDIYRLISGQLQIVYSVDNLPNAPIVLADSMKLYVSDLDSNLAKTREILMCAFGYKNSRPILFVRSETELVIYEAYNFTDIDIPNRLKIRFKKIRTILTRTSDFLQTLQVSGDHNGEVLAIASGREIEGSNGSNAGNRGRHHRHSSHHNHYHHNQNPVDWPRHLLRRFDDIGGQRGVFLAGSQPHWFIMTDRGALRAHPMNIEGPIHSFSQYGDDNFVYITRTRELRVARLPTRLDLDAYWPMKKLNLDETVHYINYHVDRRVYCIVTSRPDPVDKIMKVGNEPDTMKIEELDREGGYIAPNRERFRLRLYDPENWEQIPDCEIEFDEWEQVTCVKNVMLVSEGTTSGLKGYIALSTNYCYGEDVPNRGKIWILDLIEVVPEPDRPLTRNKIKKVYCQEQKGPVTCLSHVCGLLMSAVGQKIYLWQLKEEQLDGVAFIDTQIYIHCAASVKNLILVSDVCKSVSLLRYQQGTRTLSMVCRDSRPLEVFACDFIVNNEILNFVVMDSEANVIVFAHEPESDESHGGTRLVRKADFHLGAHVTSMCRLRAKIPFAVAGDLRMASNFRHRHLTLYSTVDGSVGYLLPVDEDMYRRLSLLQNELSIALAHVAGLNPRAWRRLRQARPSITNSCGCILDGDILTRFLSLSSKERNEMAKKVRTPVDCLLGDLQILNEASLYF